jgi:hypothetical protein
MWPTDHVPMSAIRRAASIAAVALAAAVAAAGCSSSPPGSHAAAAPQSARKAVLMAASKAAKITSFTATLNGTTSAAGTTAVTSGTIEEQTKPVLLAAGNLTVQSAPAPFPMRVVITGQAMYLKSEPLSRLVHKPWVELPFSALRKQSGLDIGSLLQQFQGKDPLADTRLFAASSQLRRIGTATASGVSTTEYGGTVNLAQALTRVPLSPSLRAQLKQVMALSGATMEHFRVWIDAQHNIRKVEEQVAGRSYRTMTTMTITSVNQPVHVTIPPASQIAVMPGT